MPREVDALTPQQYLSVSLQSWKSLNRHCVEAETVESKHSGFWVNPLRNASHFTRYSGL